MPNLTFYLEPIAHADRVSGVSLNVRRDDQTLGRCLLFFSARGLRLSLDVPQGIGLPITPNPDLPGYGHITITNWETLFQNSEEQHEPPTYSDDIDSGFIYDEDDDDY